jgi:peptide/histidine transporter 3/4
VEEVKILLRLLPIWASTAFVWTALTQMETFSVLEGATLDGHIVGSINFPPASLSVFELVNVLLILPLYDCLFVPLMRRVTGHERGITTLQRIGSGIVFSILAMLVAGLVELKRIRVAEANDLLDQPDATIPMSIFWLVPQYFFRGSTEIFTQIGQLEFFYNEVPDNMRSLGTALYLSTIAVGHYLSTVLVTVVNDASGYGGNEAWILDNLNRSKLYYFYWLLAGLSVVNFLIYLICARWYRYKPSVKRISIQENRADGPSNH